MFKIIENILPTDIESAVRQLLKDDVILISKNSYTEHKNRYGVKIYDNKILSFMKEYLKQVILQTLDEEHLHNKMLLSDVYACIDNNEFNVRWHEDSPEKYISCIIYFDEGYTGTTFLDENLSEHYCEPRNNRLLFFKTKNIIHRVKRGGSKRYTLQFSYRLISNE